jgi:2-hydroxychromene-2-carboxylate isomerase
MATFYFDLGSPYAYLTAERIERVLPGPLRWQPVLLGGLFRIKGRSSWGLSEEREQGIAEVQRRAGEYGLPPISWPEPWPSDYLQLMRAATYAFAAGRGREFAMQAFRDEFVRGHDLAQLPNVLDTAVTAGLDRDEVRDATADPEIKQALRAATDEAGELGVFGVPTIAVGEELFWGDDRLEQAAAADRSAA